MKTLTIKTVTTFANIVSSGYSDRYVMNDGNIKIVVDLDRDSLITINAYSLDDGAEQLANLLGYAKNSNEWFGAIFDFREKLSSKYQLFIRYRDGSMSSYCDTNASLIKAVITFYTVEFDRLTECGKQSAKEAAELISREELLGIKQQMDAMNALISAGVERGEVVNFNWVDG